MPTVDERLDALERQTEVLVVTMHQLVESETQLAQTLLLLERRTNESIQRFEERMELLDRAFGQSVDRLVEHLTDPEAHEDPDKTDEE